MKEPVTRRNFLATAGTAALAATATSALAAESGKGQPLKILGIACSPRQGMTTAKSVQAALDAAKAVDARIQTELIDLGGLSIAGWSPTIPKDDFDAILPKLKDLQLGGLIIGSPSYFRSLSSLCKAFIERCMPLREGVMALENKPVGALVVGGNRNGGQELVVQQILTAMLSYGMVPVGGHSPAMLGGTHDDVLQLANRLQQAAHPGLPLRFCYEAGPHGYPLCCYLRALQGTERLPGRQAPKPENQNRKPKEKETHDMARAPFLTQWQERDPIETVVSMGTRPGQALCSIIV